MSYQSILRNLDGPLKLKGKALKDITKKKKRKSRSQGDGSGETVSIPLDKLQEQEKEADLQEQDDAIAQAEAELDQADGPARKQSDIRTDAEKKYDLIMRQRLREKAAKEASVSHRQRVEKFNSYLMGLSEHFDVPRICGGA
eukprot:TRINITY_DN11371_c0_g1::TRINITY_DN11371_c0_g1_i1::g.26378::m.26378 TRINITY_DN11371_c0_g1::TRINITY_DN11371_c0_g1_i1::g.26378  ORF type:complete len:142 (-),score=22.20,sp/Q6GQN4/FA32A_DANRE/38.10/2e-08,DUF1754/PF08555.5/8.8e-08,DUF2146/PF10220.4/0.79,DUF2951/PF11166.3/6.3e+03,DUF2951/PF11166.3/0.34 TRINITY_DN11371_c0_g1_i1:575-1000(-)